MNLLALTEWPADPSNLSDIYGIFGRGNCMEPLIPEGSLHAFTKLEKPTVGDFVCVWFLPHVFCTGGHVRFKILVSETPETVDLMMLNPRTTVRFRRRDIVAMHKCFALRTPTGQTVWFNGRC